MKYLEAQVSEQKEQMKLKVPEIQKTLQILQHLQVCHCFFSLFLTM